MSRQRGRPYKPGRLLQGRARVGISHLAQPGHPVSKLTPASPSPGCTHQWEQPRAAHPSTSQREWPRATAPHAVPASRQPVPPGALCCTPWRQGSGNTTAPLPINCCHAAGALEHMEPYRENSPKACLLSDLCATCFHTGHAHTGGRWPTLAFPRGAFHARFAMGALSWSPLPCLLWRNSYSPISLCFPRHLSLPGPSEVAELRNETSRK